MILQYRVCLKAIILTAREMIGEFFESKFNNIKLSYESSKDIIVMIISGKFNEDQIKKNIFEKVDNFKKLTVEVVQKGLEIKVDR